MSWDNMSSYRDARVGLLARLFEVETRIRERESEVTDAFWESLEPERRERLTSMRESLDVVHAPSADFEDLAYAEGRLTSYLAELEELITRLPVVEEEWRRVPDEAPDPPAEREGFPLGLPTPSEARDFLRTFTEMVRRRDGKAEIVTRSPRTCLARFHDHDAPFTLRATPLTNPGGLIREVPMALVTSVSRAMPRLLVRHETLMASVGKALGLWHELEVGEPSFDGLFFVQGTREAVRRLLVPNVRARLLALSRFDVPTLEIDPPRRMASLRWRFEPAAKALDAAVRVLASIRETHADVRFRR